MIAEAQALTGVEIERVYADNGYRGRDAPKALRILLLGQKRGTHGFNRKALRRPAAIEAVIDHFKTEGHMDRNLSKARHGDHANAVLTATGHNLRLVHKWLSATPRRILKAIRADADTRSAFNPAS